MSYKGSDKMGFYNNNVVIANTKENGIYVFKNNKEDIIIDHYDHDENNIGEIIGEDLLDEFDVMIKEDGEIIFLYQNLEHILKIIRINGKDRETKILTDERLGKVFQLNIFEENSHTNILYIVRGMSENTYSIKHHILKDGNWTSFNVEDIRVDKILNPIKIVKDREDFLLTYYNKNMISIKRFNSKENSWEESISLTDNKQKLYMDIIIDQAYLHLVYCEFNQESLEIKYIRYDYGENIIERNIEHNISQEINPTNPTLLIFDKNIWIIWNESLNLFSRYSEDGGNTWSPIYLWKGVKKKDFVRYKYINNRNDENMKLDYSFGSIGEEISFLGFGPLDHVEEISKKKLVNQKTYPTIMGNWRL